MKIIDTHTHIYSNEFENDRLEVILRAKEAGITAVILPNENSNSLDALIRVCEEYENFAFPMIGLHPTSVNADYCKELHLIESALDKHHYCGIGEIGLDYYWDKSFIEAQKIVFTEQLKWSKDLQLPVAIHTRKSLKDAIDIINCIGADKLKGVFHCFSGSKEEWRMIEPLKSFYVGIGGVLTFNNSSIRETIREIPIERVLVETDAPYLSPTPFRGTRNEPSYIIETIKTLAERYSTTIEKIAIQTFENAKKLFDLHEEI